MLPLQIKARDGKGAVPSHARQAETHCDSPSWTTQEALQVCNLMTKAAISLLNVLTYLILSALNDNIHTLTHTLSLLFALCVSYCSLPWSVRALGGLNMCSELVLDRFKRDPIFLGSQAGCMATGKQIGHLQSLRSKNGVGICGAGRA